jgi:hypothetical protein
MPALLRGAADAAASAVPDASCATVSLRAGDRLAPGTSSSVLGERVDDLQHQLGEGPSVETLRTGEALVSQALHADPRWPTFGSRVRELGARAVVTSLLREDDEVVGVLSVWGEGAALSPDSSTMVSTMAQACCALVGVARRLDEQRRALARLEAERAAARVVEQATGVMLARGEGSPDAARRRLVDLGRQLGTGPDEAARQVVADATTDSEACARQ